MVGGSHVEQPSHCYQAVNAPYARQWFIEANTETLRIDYLFNCTVLIG